MAAARPHLILAGVPVRFEITFFVIIAFLGFGFLAEPAVLFAWVAVATVSILLHEMGHAVAYRMFGHRSNVVLYGFGGVTTGPHLDPARSLVVSLAGPLSALVILGVPAVLLERADLFASQGPDMSLGEWVLLFFVWINVVWSLVNLLPILPLDGGNVASATYQLVTGRDGDRPIRIVSIVTGVLAGLAALAYGFIFAAFFAGFFVVMNANALRQAKLPEWRGAVAEAQQALVSGDTERAVSLAQQIVDRRPPRELMPVVLEIGAWARLLGGDAAAAEAELARLPKGAATPATLSGSVAVAQGRVAEGLALLVWGFVNEDDGSQAFATVVVARAGLVEGLARQLLTLDGGAGVEPARRLQATLLQMGLPSQAEVVGRVLAA